MEIPLRVVNGKREMGVKYLLRNEYLWLPFALTPDDVTYSKYNQIFSFTPAGKSTVHLHVGGMLRYMENIRRKERFELRRCQISAPQVKYCMERNGITLEELSKVDQNTIDEPGLMVDWAGGTQSIVDGNHRYVLRHYDRGVDFMDFYIWPERMLAAFRLDLPQDFGIDEQNKGMGDRHDLADTFIDDIGIQRSRRTGNPV